MRTNVRDPRDFLFGLFLVTLGASGVLFARDLEIGTALDMGPGYLPTILSVLILLMGIGFVASALLRKGPAWERIAWRSVVVVTTVVVFFGVAIKSLGLVVTIVLSVMLASFASPKPAWLQSAIFAVVMASACVLIFRIALNLPLPVWPQ
jgi:hypothetical protein